MSQRYSPVRTLPKTPLPSTLMKNTGLPVLQKVSSRSASLRDRLPSRYSYAAAPAPMGYPAVMPSSRAELPAPLTRNSGSISPASQGAASSPNPSFTSQAETTRKGNVAGTTERAHRESASAAAWRTAPASARQMASAEQRKKQAVARQRFYIHITRGKSMRRRSGSCRKG